MGRQKTEILLQKIVISWHLVDKAPYNIDNKLDQLTNKYLTPLLLVQCIWIIISDESPSWVNWPKYLTLILLH